MMDAMQQTTWVYPHDNQPIYETSTFVLGSVAAGVESLTLNGQPVPLTAHDSEKAFAHVVDLDEGANTLTLVASNGDSLTRTVMRVALWSMPDDSPLIAPVLPDLATVPRCLVGEALSIRVRVPLHVASVWVQLVDEKGVELMEAPLVQLGITALNKEAQRHGERSAIFGELHYTPECPPLHPHVLEFEGQLLLDHPALRGYADAETLHIRYVVQTQSEHVTPVDLGQSLVLWQYPRLLEVSEATRALYLGDASTAKRHPLLPPHKSLFTVLGQYENAYIVQGSPVFPRFTLLGGTLVPQAGRPVPQLLDTLSHRETGEHIETTFKLHRACGALVSMDSQGVTLDLMGVRVGLNQAAYHGGTTARWQLDSQDARAGTARLRLPMSLESQKKSRGIQAQWTPEGLELTLLKKRSCFENLRILLDAGHGGDEHGTTALNGHPEKDWTLTMAQRIQHLLHEAGVVNVALTRTQDVDVPLAERAERVKAFDADICLSIHANALPDGRDPLAHKGVSIHSYTPWSRALADAIHESLVGAGRPNDGRWENNFAMTRLTTAQSVLVEYGYFIHPKEYAELLNDEVMWQLAHATVEGIRATV